MYFRRVLTGFQTADGSPPAFLRLAGDPLRWRLLSELARSDRRVGELTGLVGQPQNAVSYHLGRLRRGGLVSMRRSSADGRDSYYRIELARCGQLLAATGAAPHPGLGGATTPAARAQRAAPVRVLFLCTGNSARSQIAEALLAQAAGGRVEVASAGSHPKPLHPNAVRVMRSYGIDVTAARSKHLDEVTRRRFDYVITLCDKVREVCPELPGHPQPIHWSLPDPAAAGTGRASYPAFRAVAADLHTRIGFLIHAIAPPAPAREGRPVMTDIDDTVVNVRYLVADVQAALDFYTTHLGFTLRTAHLPAFADVTRGNLRLLLSGPASSAGRPMPDGRRPVPGGWNRIHLIVADLPAEIARLRAAGVTFRNDIVTGPGGQQVLLEDPSGNSIELFVPAVSA